MIIWYDEFGILWSEGNREGNQIAVIFHTVFHNFILELFGLKNSLPIFHNWYFYGLNTVF
jgi:hypothetical protein